MAEKVRFVIERQDGPNDKPYTQEFDVDYRPGLNVVASLMEIQKTPSRSTENAFRRSCGSATVWKKSAARA